jgi:hypothetical protein
MSSRRRNILLLRAWCGLCGMLQFLNQSAFHFWLNTNITFCYSGLEFTSLAISHNMATPNDELSTSFRNAYGNTLKPHHSFLIKPVFSAAMSAVPYRKDFYAKLGDDQEQVQREMKAWLDALEQLVAILKEFLASKEAKW